MTQRNEGKEDVVCSFIAKDARGSKKTHSEILAGPREGGGGRGGDARPGGGTTLYQNVSASLFVSAEKRSETPKAR